MDKADILQTVDTGYERRVGELASVVRSSLPRNDGRGTECRTMTGGGIKMVSFLSMPLVSVDV